MIVMKVCFRLIEMDFKYLISLSLSGAHLRRAASQDAEKRRSSLGNVPTARHRASDAFLDPQHAAMLFRDSRGVSNTRCIPKKQFNYLGDQK